MPVWDLIFDSSDSDSPDESDNNYVQRLLNVIRLGPDSWMPSINRRFNLGEYRRPHGVRNAQGLRPVLAERTTPASKRRSRSLSALDSSDALNPLDINDTDEPLELERWPPRSCRCYHLSHPLRDTRRRPGGYMQDIVATTSDETESLFIYCLVFAAIVTPLCILFYKLATSIINF
ncbi:uncharacterized protein LOC108670520 [Hyalella azteca]|uniref:Uncharacterized protein LOC108670520 n=1 Tax=Hyalella azteca TaxID=294128 RepID=A0A8B7NIL9_HYAAZ|nr:uncharacterized protein LOC108670520 [Hyalella azteca]